MARSGSKRGVNSKRRRGFPRRRRAMVLLVVLSLLAIFTLITVSFVLLASQGRITAQAAARSGQRGDNPNALLREAMLQLIRGTRNPMSPLQAHSLLEDMYGNDAVTGRVTAYIDTVPPRASFPNTSGIVFETQVQVDDRTLAVSADPYGMRTRFARRGYFNGCVLTMLSGPLKGKSTRIVDCRPLNPPTPLAPNSDGVLRLQLQAFPNGGTPDDNDRFVINGRPFNGVGFGMMSTIPSRYVDTTSGRLLPLLSVSDGELLSMLGGTSAPRALLPNHVFALNDPDAAHSPYRDASGNNIYDPAGPGGSDEAYDAADFQNMHIAMQYWDSNVNSVVTRLPSFHRPDLLNWWSYQVKDALGNPIVQFDTAATNVILDRLSDNAALAAVVRKAMMRPAPAEHPNFPGNNNSGPMFHPLWGYGTQADPQWDVDNDGDGKRDSIWMDLGMPAQAMPDGRWYKPMYAVLCIDMDGRLNLNAHGNPNHITLAKHFDPVAPAPVNGPFAGSMGSITALAGSAPAFHFGQGYGPAEVNLRRVLPINASGDPLMNLFGGAYFLEGRYGEQQSSRRGATTNIRAGITNDYLAPSSPGRFTMQNLDQMDMPASYGQILTNQLTLNPMSLPYAPNNFGTPPDLDGDGVLALDHRGVPYYASVPTTYRIGPHGFGEDAEMYNDPYELDLSKTASASSISQPSSGTHPPITVVDAPFTPEELERYLRRYDADADYGPSGSGGAVGVRASRLTELAPMLMSDPSLQTLFTTTSWDVPVAGIGPSVDNFVNVPSRAPGEPGTYAVPRAQGLSIQDLLAARLREKTPSITDQQINDAIHDLLAPELLAGRKMDLNRPFGNGRDDVVGGVGGMANGVVDEPGEAMSEMMVAPSRVMTRQPISTPMDLNNDGVIDLRDQDARQQFAKHLYVLMMLLVDEQFRQGQTGWAARTAEGSSDARQEVARRIAQWVVNVVDFRDRDSINTGFEFDLEPFTVNPSANPALTGTWNVDGDLATNNDSTTRCVVWGVERPELLITEAIATHDRRTEDTASDSGTGDYKRNQTDNTQNDQHFDQPRRPQGNLIVELYNPGSVLDAPHAELHSASTPGTVDFGIRLDATTGTNPANSSPIWRLSTHRTAIHGGATNIPPELDELNGGPTNNGALFYQSPLLDPAEIGRIVYFTADNQAQIRQAPGNPTAPPNPPRPVFFREASVPATPLRPGHYALVGPASPTLADNTPATNSPIRRVYLGKRERDTNPANKKNNYPFFIQLAGGPVGPYSVAGGVPTPLKPANAKDIVGIVIDSYNTAAGNQVRMSISEPDTGYPVMAIPSDPNPGHQDGFFEDGQIRDEPYDLTTTALMVDTLGRNAANPELRNEDLKSMVYLERLADPTRPYNLQTNPYLTVDRMFVSVRPYTGEPDRTGGSEETVGITANFVADAFDFDSFRRGMTPPNPANTPALDRRNIWSPWTQRNELSDINTGSLTAPLTESTFGSLNGGNAAREFGPFFSTVPAPMMLPNSAVTAYAYGGDPDSTTNPVDGPFPWLTWNNRPFTSAMELLLVPCTSQPGLLLEHSIADTAVNNPYQSPPAGTNAPVAYQDIFRHLANFFNSSDTRSAVGARPEFHRLFDYVGVPSRFAGTTDLLDPTEFSVGTDHRLHPPFNKLSRYREPGKINLNTIYDARVWDALTDGVFGLTTPTVPPALPALPQRWTKFWESRRGYALPASAAEFDPTYPTIFANPFRPSGANPFVPPVPQTLPATGTDRLVQDRDVDVTLLRPERGGTDPLLAISATGSAAHVDAGRNPYFRYAGLQKIENSVTTRSNVYAIWVTVGYFEVKPVPISATHPDGWELGPEVGTDTGEMKRHRAFYLYDRTIPVGFERGETLNVEDGLLIQRYLD
jgi:hypothetical protein